MAEEGTPPEGEEEPSTEVPHEGYLTLSGEAPAAPSGALRQMLIQSNTQEGASPQKALGI